MAKVLSELDDIRQWTEARGGNPIMADMPETGGREQHLLGLTFDQHMLNADGNEGPDRAASHFDLVDWAPGTQRSGRRIWSWWSMTIWRETGTPTIGS